MHKFNPGLVPFQTVLGRERSFILATISARIDDGLKEKAETIADSIGLPLSSVISVFLKRFIAENGFPFDVKVTESATVLNQQMLETSVKQAVSDPKNPRPPKSITYLDPQTQQLKTIQPV